MLHVTLIAHTPEPERVVAAAAKLCYSKVGVTNLLDGLTPEVRGERCDRLMSYPAPALIITRGWSPTRSVWRPPGNMAAPSCAPRRRPRPL